MSPRPYRLGQREAAVEATRTRILAAARDLLAADADIAAFTVDTVVSAFCGFWASDRVVIRRLRALAALDRDIGQSIHARDLRRREGLRTMCDRLVKAGRTPEVGENQLDILATITSFEVFDMLAGTSRGEKEAADLVAHLVRNELGRAAAVRPGRRGPRSSA